MASTIKQRLRRFNGTDYDTVHLETQESQIIADYSKYMPINPAKDALINIPAGTSTTSEFIAIVNQYFLTLPLDRVQFVLINGMSTAFYLMGHWHGFMFRSYQSSTNMQYGVLTAWSYSTVNIGEDDYHGFMMQCARSSWSSPTFYSTVAKS